MTEAQQASDPQNGANNKQLECGNTAESNAEETEQEEHEAFQRLLDQMDEDLRRLRLELRREQDRGGRGRLWLVGLPMPQH